MTKISQLDEGKLRYCASLLNEHLLDPNMLDEEDVGVRDMISGADVLKSRDKAQPETNQTGEAINTSTHCYPQGKSYFYTGKEQKWSGDDNAVYGVKIEISGRTDSDLRLNVGTLTLYHGLFTPQK